MAIPMGIPMEIPLAVPMGFPLVQVSPPPALPVLVSFFGSLVHASPALVSLVLDPAVLEFPVLCHLFLSHLSFLISRIALLIILGSTPV